MNVAVDPFLQLDVIRNVARANKKVKDCYRLLYHKELWLQAYRHVKDDSSQHHKKNDQQTIDALIEQIKQGSFRFSRRECLTHCKVNCYEKTICQQSFQDKIVQEVIRMILNEIYEPIFSKSAHGLRRNSTAHSALLQIKNDWQGLTWGVATRLKNLKLKHRILLQCISKKIDDRRFLLLIQNALKNKTDRNGAFQRLLIHIYLHEFDLFVEQQSQEFNPTDRKKRRIQYVRYRNEFVVGMACSKKEAMSVTRMFTTFLRDKLSIHSDNLTVSHFEKGIIFLNYELKLAKVGGAVTNPVNRAIQLEIPYEKLSNIARENGYGNLDQLKSIHRNRLLNKTELQILKIYNRELRKISNFYKLAMNYKQLNKLFYLAESSFLKTMAAKRKSTVKKTVLRMRKYVQGRLSLANNDKHDPSKLTHFVKLSDLRRKNKN